MYPQPSRKTQRRPTANRWPTAAGEGMRDKKNP